MLRTRSVVAAVLTALSLVLVPAAPAAAFAHIEGGGVFTWGSGTWSPGLSDEPLAPQRTEMRFTGVGATWHLLYADAIDWDCGFTIGPDVPGSRLASDLTGVEALTVSGFETLAAGAGTAVGGCTGTPKTIGTGQVDITCPLIGPMAYARVGTVVELAGVCLADWNGVSDISDVTFTLLIKPNVPGGRLDEPPQPITEFAVELGAFRYRG